MLEKTLIIIPTYNEEPNINPIARQVLLHSDFKTHILFVDDNSPDGTQAQIKNLINEFPDNVFLLSRTQKEGLGKAYVAGFYWGLEKGYEAFIEMDADLSHDPKYLPQMLELLRLNDVVIGSRYIKGGGTINWSIFRKIISRLGSLYGRIILGVQILDLTGGFNGIRREVLEKINIATLTAGGYVFQIELKYRALSAGFSLVEFPIYFAERQAGASKMSLSIVFEAIYKVLLLRFRKKR